MPATIVSGAQWGDEGKGKLVDQLASKRIGLFDFKAVLMPMTRLLSVIANSHFITCRAVSHTVIVI